MLYKFGALVKLQFGNLDSALGPSATIDASSVLSVRKKLLQLRHIFDESPCVFTPGCNKLTAT